MAENFHCKLNNRNLKSGWRLDEVDDGQNRPTSKNIKSNAGTVCADVDQAKERKKELFIIQIRAGIKGLIIEW